MAIVNPLPVGRFGGLSRLGIAAIVLVLLVVAGATGCGVEIVDTGHRGVRTTFGQVQGASLPEGLYFYNPLTSHIIEMDARVQKIEGDTPSYTRDVQQAKVHYALNFRLNPESAHLVYQQVGLDWADKLIPQVITEEVKRVFGQYEAVDIISKRDEVARSIEAKITELLRARNVITTGFQLTNIDYANEFERAVEAKVVAQQRAIEEQNRTQQIEAQAKQKIIAAEAEARSIKIRAEALAQNARLVEWEAVQKWNGQLPNVMGGGAVPFLNLQGGGAAAASR